MKLSGGGDFPSTGSAFVFDRGCGHVRQRTVPFFFSFFFFCTFVFRCFCLFFSVIFVPLSSGTMRARSLLSDGGEDGSAHGLGNAVVIVAVIFREHFRAPDRIISFCLLRGAAHHT